MMRNEINVFGEESLGRVVKLGKNYIKYAVRRNSDNVILAVSDTFKNYVGCDVRTMYTGSQYATGDFILVADTENGSKEIYRWKEDKLRELSTCEKMCLSVILDYENDELNMYEITEKVNSRFNKNWTCQTVCTYLSRISDKGYIEIYKVGRYSHYKPLVTKEQMIKNEVNNIALIYGIKTTSEFIDSLMVNFI